MMHVFLLYGVGKKYSIGLDRLGAKLATIPDVTVHRTFQHFDETAVEAVIRGVPANHKITIIGHSAGAGEGTVIAADIAPRQVELLVCFDLSWWMTKVPVGGNVKRVISFYGRSFYNLLGIDLMKFTPGWKGKRISTRVYGGHARMDDRADLHGIVFDALSR